MMLCFILNTSMGPNEFCSCSFNQVCKASEDDEDWLNGVTIRGHPCGQFGGIRVSDD
ncbi:hypothetical protein BDZ91DRAFT_719926 [Kalaharituber pfeilii]|nr:hypothetical protein BDZ91DRAFT_719926 [Kalaharituber pfeilii]